MIVSIVVSFMIAAYMPAPGSWPVLVIMPASPPGNRELIGACVSTLDVPSPKVLKIPFYGVTPYSGASTSRDVGRVGLLWFSGGPA